jgi:hypothetical protein
MSALYGFRDAQTIRLDVELRGVELHDDGGSVTIEPVRVGALYEAVLENVWLCAVRVQAERDDRSPDPRAFVAFPSTYFAARGYVQAAAQILGEGWVL